MGVPTLKKAEARTSSCCTRSETMSKYETAPAVRQRLESSHTCILSKVRVRTYHRRSYHCANRTTLPVNIGNKTETLQQQQQQPQTLAGGRNLYGRNMLVSAVAAGLSRRGLLLCAHPWLRCAHRHLTRAIMASCAMNNENPENQITQQSSK